MLTRFGFHPRISVVGITGGPSSGKTTLLAIAKQWIEDRGSKVVILSETATEFVMSGFPLFPAGWKEPLQLQSSILMRVLFLEDLYHQMCENLQTDKQIVLIVDRPALDGMAYVGRPEFLRVLERLALDLHEVRERYKAIIHCETAAASKGYTVDNNPARSENALQALELDQKTWETWLGHQHHIRIPAEEEFEKKKLKFLKALSRILKMPEPFEIERKWRIDNFNQSMIPESAGRVEIVQTYLSSNVGVERRVRMRTADGSSSYYETKKYSTYLSMTRIEDEKQISRSEYEKLLLEADPECAPVIKTRFSWEFDGRTMELDVYKDIPGLAILEVELPTEDAEVRLPPGPNYFEVTKDRYYKNRSIAQEIKDGLAERLVNT